MTQYQNPYASPLADPAVDLPSRLALNDGMIADGNRLRVAMGAEFPDRCVKCNAPAHGYLLPRKLAWHPSWLYVLILPGVVFYALVALLLTKRAICNIGLCKQHRQKRRRFQMVCYSIVALGFLGIVAGFALPSFALGISSTIVAIAASLVGLAGTQVISAAKITDEYALIKGCGAEFLHSFG